MKILWWIIVWCGDTMQMMINMNDDRYDMIWYEWSIMWYDTKYDQ